MIKTNITLKLTYAGMDSKAPTFKQIKKDIKKGLEQNKNIAHVIVDQGQNCPMSSKSDDKQKGGLKYIKQANRYRQAIENNSKYSSLQYDFRIDKHAILDNETNITYYFNNLVTAYNVLIEPDTFILLKGKMKDGTKIQLENWNNDLEHTPFGSTIGTYPIAKRSKKGQFSPKEGKTFRCGFTFESNEVALEVFDSLIAGETKLKDYVVYLDDQRNKELL